MTKRLVVSLFTLALGACGGGNAVVTSPSPTSATPSPTPAGTPPPAPVTMNGSAIDRTTGMLVGGLTKVLILDGPNEGKAVSFRGNYIWPGLQPGTFTVRVTAHTDLAAGLVAAQPYIESTQTVTLASSGKQDFLLEQQCHFKIQTQFSPTLGGFGRPGQLFRAAGFPLPIPVLEMVVRIDKFWGDPSCRWTFTSSEPWVTLTPSSGTGGNVLPNGPTISEGGDTAILRILLSPVLFQCAVITVGDHVDSYNYDHHVHISNFGVGAAGTSLSVCDPYFEKFPSRKFP